MARIVFGMNVSLDGYVDHDRMSTGPELFKHWTEHVGGLTGSVYGRGIYELMRIWDEDRPDWSPAHREFAMAWRRLPKWVVSRTLTSVGPNATLVSGDVGALVRELKGTRSGDITVSGPVLAQALTELGLIDEYRLYFIPAVLGSGRPFFVGPRPPLRLVGADRFDEDVIRLTYVPA